MGSEIGSGGIAVSWVIGPHCLLCINTTVHNVMTPWDSCFTKIKVLMLACGL